LVFCICLSFSIPDSRIPDCYEFFLQLETGVWKLPMECRDFLIRVNK
jgi:hypothetical protein